MCTSTKLPLFLSLLKFPSKILLASLDKVVTTCPKVTELGERVFDGGMCGSPGRKHLRFTAKKSDAYPDL